MNHLKIAEALKACDWSGVGIGNKVIIQAAITALSVQPVAHFLLIDGEYHQLADEYSESPEAVALYKLNYLDEGSNYES